LDRKNARDRDANKGPGERKPLRCLISAEHISALGTSWASTYHISALWTFWLRREVPGGSREA
jgi:hypothetical protein